MERISVSQAHRRARKIAGAKVGEIVHHKDGDVFNNSPENLEVLGGYREHAEQHPCLGKPPKWQKGRNHTEATREKMSESQRRRHINKPFSEETKHRISEKRKQFVALHRESAIRPRDSVGRFLKDSSP